MARFKLWTLTKENTSPFVIVAVFYSLLLAIPFMYFIYTHGQLNSVPEEYYTALYEESSQNEPDNVQNKITQKDIDEFDWRQNKETGPFVMLTRLAVFSAVLAFGAIGSAVSLITRVRSKGTIGKITALELISIQTIGAIFAAILMLIFVSDFIGGRLFPEPDLFYRIIYVHPAFAKLLIWSFIAGFSERFVPNILNNLVKEGEKKNEESETEITT